MIVRQARAKAPRITPCRRCADSVRMPTAAGNSGLIIVPSGSVEDRMRAMPELRNREVVERIERIDEADTEQGVAFVAARSGY